MRKLTPKRGLRRGATRGGLMANRNSVDTQLRAHSVTLCASSAQNHTTNVYTNAKATHKCTQRMCLAHSKDHANSSNAQRARAITHCEESEGETGRTTCGGDNVRETVCVCTARVVRTETGEDVQIEWDALENAQKSPQLFGFLDRPVGCMAQPTHMQIRISA